MLPLKDYNPTTSVAWVTVVLIAVNVVIFLSEPITGSARTQATYFACHGAIPYEVTHGKRAVDALSQGVRFESDQDIAFAALEQSCPRKNVWLSILTSMFLHGSIAHIGFNMLFLWVFGNNIEDRLGRMRYIIFYLLCGIAAALLQVFMEPRSGAPMVGASGAISGVMGGYLVLYPRVRVYTLLPLGFFITTVALPAWAMLIYWMVLQLAGGLTGILSEESGGVAFWAHVGGFLAGVVLIKFFAKRNHVDEHQGHPWRPRQVGWPS